MVTIFSILKKEYCGLLGGLTFYRTRHICKSGKKKKKTFKNEHLPFLAQGMYQHNYVQKGPFLWAMYSSLQLHNFFLVHASGRLSFLGFLQSWFVLGEPICCMGESREFWSRAACCRLCVLTHVGSCVPNYQAKSDKTTYTGRHCGCLITSSCLLFVVYTKMH